MLDFPALREVFRRLNKTNEPLLPQELRHAAYTGDFVKFVEAAGSSPALAELGVFTARDYLRRRNDELMSEIAAAVIARAYPNKKEGLDELYSSYERHGMPNDVHADLTQRFGRAFAQLAPIAGRLRRTRFRNKSDFYTLFVVLARNAEVLPLTGEAAEQLAAELEQFSATVNAIRKERAESRPAAVRRLERGRLGTQAAAYLSAVDVASSDRLSRVRRGEALADVTAPAMATAQPVALTIADGSWLVDGFGSDEPEEEDMDSIEEEKARTEAAIVGA